MTNPPLHAPHTPERERERLEKKELIDILKQFCILIRKDFFPPRTARDTVQVGNNNGVGIEQREEEERISAESLTWGGSAAEGEESVDLSLWWKGDEEREEEEEERRGEEERVAEGGKG